MRKDICLNNEVVGVAKIEKQGLYYSISGRFSNKDGKIYRMIVKTGDENLDLGICVPFCDGFGVEKRISAKKILPDEMKIYLLEKSQIYEERFYPIYEDRPFSRMDSLRNVRFEKREDVTGLVIL